MKELRELAPRWGGRQSFYWKALVVQGNGCKTLYSYGTPVVRIGRNGNVLRLWSGWSATSWRHIKEFLLQEGLTMTKKQWDKMKVTK